MAQDNKYGKVILERGDVGEDEPVVVFRARDMHLPEMLYAYSVLCRKNGSPPGHLELIEKDYGDIQEWQEAHLDQVHIPTSETSKAWMK